MMNRSKPELERVIKCLYKEKIQKLQENDFKPHWLDSTLYDLYSGMMQEMNELFIETIDKDINIDFALLECADISNYIDFLADKLRSLRDVG